MTEEKIKEYYKLLDMLSVSISASKWINSNKHQDSEVIIAFNEQIYRKLLEFGINNIGFCDE